MAEVTSKEIFALRREGKIDEALPLARSLYAEKPDDEWNLRALAWCLISAFYEEKHVEAQRALSDELEGLPKLEADELLVASRRKIADRIDPLHQAIYAAKTLSRTGDHHSAYKELSRLRREHGSSLDLDTSLAWEIFRLLNEELKAEHPRTEMISAWLLEYAKLDVAKPSDIHSRILDVAARAASKEVFPRFCGFFAWWGSSKLQEIDFNQDKAPDGGFFPSTVEKVISALGKTLKGEVCEERIQHAASFIQQHYKKYPDQDFFPYYLALAHIKLGNRENALPILLPVVRSKINEFWAWSHLADCFEPQDPRYLSCLCRAVSCRVPSPEFLLNVRLDLAEAFHHIGRDVEGGFELQEVLKIKEQHGWALKERERELSNAAWYKTLRGKVYPADYAMEGRGAEHVLVQDLPQVAAVLAEVKIKFGKKQSLRHMVDVQARADKIISVPVLPNLFPRDMQLQPGTPLAVRIDSNRERLRILDVTLREGSSWDILPILRGVLSDINPNKHLSVIQLEDGSIALCYYDKFPEACQIPVGTFLDCRFSHDSKGRAHLRAFTPSKNREDSPYWKFFSGAFRPRGLDRGGGGHVGHVFIPGQLVKFQKTPKQLEVLAVKQSGDTPQDTWWKAITAKSIELTSDL